jgi:hypothetical protein
MITGLIHSKEQLGQLGWAWWTEKFV